MEEEGEYQEVRFHPVDVDVERRYEYEEEDGEDGHLPENNPSFLVFFRKKQTVEDEAHRDSYEDGEKSHQREYVGKYTGGLEGPEKYIGEEKSEKSAQETGGDAPERGKSDGNGVYLCRSKYILIRLNSNFLAHVCSRWEIIKMLQ